MAIVLAERGHQVVLAGCDVEQAGSRQLAARARRSARTGRLRFTPSRAAAARHGHVVVMAVATQPDRGDEDRISTLLEAAVEIARNLSGPTVIVDQSSESDAAAAQIARAMIGSSNHAIVVVKGKGAREGEPGRPSSPS